MELQAELTQKDQQFLEQSLNGPMWKVILQIGTPLALYQLLSQAFTILDTMMAAHISEESVSAVAYLAQLNAILSAVGLGLNDLFMFVGVTMLNIAYQAMKVIATFCVTWYNFFTRKKFLAG